MRGSGQRSTFVSARSSYPFNQFVLSEFSMWQRAENIYKNCTTRDFSDIDKHGFHAFHADCCCEFYNKVCLKSSLNSVSQLSAIQQHEDDLFDAYLSPEPRAYYIGHLKFFCAKFDYASAWTNPTIFTYN